MAKTTTKQGKQIKLLTPTEWYDRMGCGHLVAFEQMVYQSRGYKVCIECLASDNLIECQNHLLPTDGHHSKDYYMCQDCIDYYNNK